MVTIHLFLYFKVRSLKMVASGSHQPGDWLKVLGGPDLKGPGLSGDLPAVRDRGDESDRSHLQRQAR